MITFSMRGKLARVSRNGGFLTTAVGCFRKRASLFTFPPDAGTRGGRILPKAVGRRRGREDPGGRTARTKTDLPWEQHASFAPKSDRGASPRIDRARQTNAL